MPVNQDVVFKAIADPTRRKIIDLLSLSDHSVKELTSFFDMSQPAVSQHLRELRYAQLVEAEKVGLENRYRLNVTPLRRVFCWVEKYKRLFDPVGHAWEFRSSLQVARSARSKTRKGGGIHGS